MHHHNKRNFWSRREFLFRAGGGISGLALADLLNQQGLLAAPATSDACSAPPLGSNPYAVKPPHFKPRAKAVISLFMTGGPSAVDLWDYKEGLVKYAGQPLDESRVGDIHVRQGYPGPLMPSPFEFKRMGQSGKLVSEVATRARQAGVPCFAVCGHRELDTFGARVLDLQAVVEASTVAELARAGRRLVELMWA